MSDWDSSMDGGVKNFHYWTENHFYEFAFGVQAMVAALAKRLDSVLLYKHYCTSILKIKKNSNKK